MELKMKDQRSKSKPGSGEVWKPKLTKKQVLTLSDETKTNENNSASKIKALHRVFKNFNIKAS